MGIPNLPFKKTKISFTFLRNKTALWKIDGYAKFDTDELIRKQFG